AVQVDPLDASDVAVGHQRHRAARFVLAPVAELLEAREDLSRRRNRQIPDELDEVLESRFSVLLERLHFRSLTSDRDRVTGGGIARPSGRVSACWRLTHTRLAGKLRSRAS